MFFPPQVTPPPVVTIVERESHYDIQATDEPGLVKEMNAKGPTTLDGNFWANTSVVQSFTYDTRMQGSVCVLVKPQVRVSINIVYPSWTPGPGVRPAVVSKWKALSVAIHRHEEEHAQLSRDAAAALEALVKRHPTDATCEALGDYIKRGAAAIDHKQRTGNRELDARTRHGSTEGVAISW